MRGSIVLIFALAMTAVPSYAAQLYRWVDEKGHVEWRDTPPPPTAKHVEQRTIGVSTIETNELPYSLQQAVKNFPVTLWVTSCGELCDKARALLSRRGVPYTEKNPESDLENFKKASGGSLELPLLVVGSNRIKGYVESSWDDALDMAGYPKTALVPIKPQPAAPASPKPPAAAPAPAETASNSAPAPQPAAPVPAAAPASAQ